jgi:hypothetical protein
MRTTIDLPGDVEKELSTNYGYRVTLPILDSKEPGTLDLTNAEIEQLTLP